MLKKITKSNIVLTTLGVVIIALLKLLFQFFGIEFLSVNPLLTAIISGNIFILGFLLNSTLRDYKEAEKFPGDIASSLETIYDECEILNKSKKEKCVEDCILHIKKLNELFPKWFKKQEYTQSVLDEISNFNRFWGEFEAITQANFIVRLKNEQNNLRKMLIRVNILRDTPFYETSYKIARLSVFFMIILLTLLSSDPFYEYLLFVCMIAFMNIFLVNLIKDLDDPFEYHLDNKADEVSLKPFDDLKKRIVKRSETSNK